MQSLELLQQKGRLSAEPQSSSLRVPGGLQGENREKKKKSFLLCVSSTSCLTFFSQGTTCSITPPLLESGLRIPGGIGMTETAYYLVKEPLTEGYRVRMNVVEGLANMKASIGRVPQKNRFQLVGLNDDAEGREVTLVISTTVPCPECGMGDQSLYVLVEVSACAPRISSLCLDFASNDERRTTATGRRSLRFGSRSRTNRCFPASNTARRLRSCS
jgi:hypothetical protein